MQDEHQLPNLWGHDDPETLDLVAKLANWDTYVNNTARDLENFYYTQLCYRLLENPEELADLKRDWEEYGSPDVHAPRA